MPLLLNTVEPAYVFSDGNCLFRSVSIAYFGAVDWHDELRLRTAIEIGLHRDWYDKDASDYHFPFKDDARIKLSDYVTLCRDVAKSGTMSDVNTILALSAVIELPIQMYYPRLRGDLFEMPELTRVVVGRGVNKEVGKVTIMWTTTGDIERVEDVVINHIVPLLKADKANSMTANDGRNV